MYLETLKAMLLKEGWKAKHDYLFEKEDKYRVYITQKQDEYGYRGYEVSFWERLYEDRWVEGSYGLWYNEEKELMDDWFSSDVEVLNHLKSGIKKRFLGEDADNLNEVSFRYCQERKIAKCQE